ncbi:MAG TPA: DUF456 domain-containing protein, partial [Anaerolineales bacterium]|nr:DUF456 domain-containing protein [Anaerolineales bacterium]
MFPPELLSSLQSAWIVVVDILVLIFLLLALFGLLIPIFPGLTVMWGVMFIYALLQSTAQRMTFWDWILFAFITLMMIAGNIVDNIIIARKMRDKFIPWSSIILAFVASIVASLFLTPLVGLAVAPIALFLIEYRRLRDRTAALDSTKAYMVGWGWSFAARFTIGVLMLGSWMLWA